MGLKDVTIILGLRVVSPAFHLNSRNEPTFKDRFSLTLNKLATMRSITNLVSTFIKQLILGKERINMSDLNFKNGVLVCFVHDSLFPNREL